MAVINREAVKSRLEKQIIDAAHNSDSTTLSKVVSMLSDDELWECLSEENRAWVNESRAFKIRYENEDSEANGQEYLVREIEGYDHHYFITGAGYGLVGGGKLARKYCKRI